jgi:hypothetical protein
MTPGQISAVTLFNCPEMERIVLKDRQTPASSGSAGALSRAKRGTACHGQAGMWVSNWFGLDRALTRIKSPSVRPETDRAMQDLDRLGANLNLDRRQREPGGTVRACLCLG